MTLTLATIAQMSPQQIAEARAQAKREYDAKIALFDAVENYVKLAAGDAAQTPPAAHDKPRGEPQAPMQPHLAHLEALFGVSAKDAEELAQTEKAFDVLDTLKDKILLAALQANGIMPSGIATRLKEVGAVADDYPTSHISPKISAYRDHGLMEQRPNGWHVTPKGRDRIIQAIMIKGPSNVA